MALLKGLLQTAAVALVVVAVVSRIPQVRKVVTGA
jgi:hypothetical protein